MTAPVEPPWTGTILVVDDDADIARFVELNLAMQGYEVMVAGDAVSALSLIATDRVPDLAIIDLMMPDIDGLELTRRLRADPLTTSVPIIMLTARSLAVDKVLGLHAGADDYLVKPFDTLELIARVYSIMRRNQEYREVSPLTGLPGNSRILREVADRVRSGSAYAVCHFDIDRFKSVNDVYGFARGDEFISALARSLHAAVRQTDPPPPFLGHIGGDDFVLVCTEAQVRPLTEKAVADFEAAADALYDPADAARGYVELPGRRGEVKRATLVTISVGVALSSNRTYQDPREVVAVASEMKTVAKSQPGSYVAMDRRGSGNRGGGISTGPVSTGTISGGAISADVILGDGPAPTEGGAADAAGPAGPDLDATGQPAA
jgi:diguanylate cyclase (GGDEF)-like protein